MYVARKGVRIVELRNGRTFNSFGCGDAGLELYRIWGDYEYGVRPKDVKKYRIVIDIGAHIGLFSVFLAVVNPDCKVLCYEIDRNNLEKLKQNTRNCGVTNVVPFNLAVTDKSDVIDYFPGRDSSEFSTTKISFSGDRPIVEERLKTIGKVRSVTLNEIIRQNNLPFVDFLKLDCEGAEFEILYATTRENLRRINKMGGEYHEHGKYTANDLIAYLSKFGFLKKMETRQGIGLIQYTKR
jgi:FkbM family methyltransferase